MTCQQNLKKLISIPCLLPIFWSISLIALMGAGFIYSEASAQELNQRKHAPPGATAKKARVLTEARSQAAMQNDANLNRSTVNTDCSPIEIGNQDLSGDKRLSRNEQVVVVPGDIINICR